MRRTIALILGFAIATATFLNATGQQNSKQKLTLEDLYKNNVFRQKGITAVRWMKDNKGYSALETNQNVGGKDIVVYDANSGNRKVLVSAEKLIPAGKKNALLISDYAWSVDNSKLLIFTNTRKVWRQHTRGDYWVLDLNNAKLTQIGSSFEPARLMFAKFSPDAKNVGFVYKNNIYVQALETNKTEKLTFEGKYRNINGIYDLV